MLLATGEPVTLESVRSALPAAPDISPALGMGSGPLANRVANFERETILAELKRSSYHMTNAAKALGLERSHLYKKAEQLGIDIQRHRREDEADAG